MTNDTLTEHTSATFSTQLEESIEPVPAIIPWQPGQPRPLVFQESLGEVVDETPPVFVCEECGREFPTNRGVEMHRTRTHISDEQKAIWVASVRRTNERKRALNETRPEVLAILNEGLTGSKNEKGARRKRAAASRKRGETADQFLVAEMERARKIFERNQSKPQEFETPQTLALVETAVVAPVKPVDEHKVADEMFRKIGAATDALFPNRVPAERIIEVAEWQTATLRMMQR